MEDKKKWNGAANSYSYTPPDDKEMFDAQMISNLQKRIAELNKVLQLMIEEVEVDLDYRGMNIRSYCPLCGEVSYGEFSSMQELRHKDTCPWVTARKLISEGGADD